jgi:seryl-tRNA(Sec) selenium transferase
VLEAAGEHLGSDLLRRPVGTGGDASELVFKFSGESDFHIASVTRAQGTGSDALRAQSVCGPLLRREGFDLVAFSGGKALRGPQCSGLLTGRTDLIEAAIRATNPYASIGRGMKVGKEEMVGLLAAIERYLKVDHQAEFQELDSRVQYMIEKLSMIPGLTADRQSRPHLRLTWAEDAFKFEAGEVVRQLMQGDPPIAISRRGDRLLHVSVWMMRPGEHQTVTRRLQEVFAG